MKTTFFVFLAALATTAYPITANALPGSGSLGKDPSAHPMDCAKAKDRTRCEALNKEIAACRDKIGDEWRECMHRPAPDTKFSSPKLRDCATARNKERCETHNTALEACKDKTTRTEHRKCMTAQLRTPTER